MTRIWMMSMVLLLHACLSAAGARAGSIFSYTPASLLRPGQYELKLFNNLYTQTAVFDENGDRRDTERRATYFTGIVNFLYGVNTSVNAGVDITVKSVRIDDRSSSPLSVFRFSSGSEARTALASIAPRLKIAPIGRLPRLAMQTSLLIPVADDLEGRPAVDKPFLDYDAVQWWTQILYDLPLGSAAELYMESSVLVRFEEERTDLLTPVKGICNLHPAHGWIVYALGEIGPTWDATSWSSYYSQAGIGAKHQLRPSLELESLVSVFPLGRMNGAGWTINLGMRIVR